MAQAVAAGVRRSVIWRTLADDASPARWRLVVALIALAGLLVRLLLISHSHGGSDLRLYTYFSRLALHGINPYTAPAQGPVPGSYGDSPPLEVAAFAGLLGVHDSATTLRIFFALVDAALILIVGLLFLRSKAWRLGFVLFYALNPLVLISWTVFAEDKTILFLGIVIWLLALERGREALAWVAATSLTVLKFLGSFATPAMALHSWRERRSRAALYASGFVLVFLLSNLPWFPHSLDAFSRRSTRLDLNPPIHASPMILPARLHVYAPIEAKLLTAAAIILALSLLARRRIDIREAVVWSILGGYFFLPDEVFNRILLITLPVILLTEMSTARWVGIWIVSSIAALGLWVATRGVPHTLAPIGGFLRSAFGHEYTLRHVFWMHLTLALVIGFYLADRWRGSRGDEP